MTKATFPGTQTSWTLLGPSAPGKHFSAIYRSNGAPGGSLASVNAGNDGLGLGGGGINKTFGDLFGPVANGFFNPHQSAYQAAVTAGAKTAVISHFDAGAPVQLVSVLLANGQGPTGAYPQDEAALLDILTAAVRPHNEPSNYAMIYAVPPDGRNPPYATDKIWLDSITRTAGNIVTVLADYNANQVAAHPGLAAIPVLRMCMIGGKIFRPPDMAGKDPAPIAAAIYAGITNVLVALEKASVAHGITMVEFESGDHEFASLK